MIALGNISTAAGAAVGGVAVLGLTLAWTNLVTVPAAKEETRAVVEAEAEQRTFHAIKSVTDAAERARAMRRYCSLRGLRYDFETSQCGG